MWGRPPRGRPCAVFGFHLEESRRPAVWYLTDPSGCRPAGSPLGNRQGSPDPSAAPLGPPQAGEMMWLAAHAAGADASAAIDGWQHTRTGGWQRMALGLASARYTRTASCLRPRVRCAGRQASRRVRTAAGPICGGHGGATPRVGWRGQPRHPTRGAQPREDIARPSRSCKRRRRRNRHIAPDAETCYTWRYDARTDC
jgi:hypothetical protein